MNDDDLVGVGLDLRPATLLKAYRVGLFPMRLSGRTGQLGWWSPDPRGILPLDRLRVSRSLRQSARRYTVTLDRDFTAVIAACADPARPDAWIGEDFVAAYTRLHRMGRAHSVETWLDGRLVGGLYGVCVGGLFAGESMFHRATDASKVALVRLVEVLTSDGVPGRLLDCQWTTPHLVSLGARDVARAEYLELLAAALELPEPPEFRHP
ncbi:MAG TPA: leucyl/phenylalanyl-tRNA--protein transferase [Actinomycetes bacterium]|nr:leucyl/phenylalanyl-tRNA--protein transferase [Actinomycetes bacterium]